ncbi:MAG: diguanylate cyclase [Deferribacterales bacterium]
MQNTQDSIKNRTLFRLSVTLAALLALFTSVKYLLIYNIHHKHPSTDTILEIISGLVFIITTVFIVNISFKMYANRVKKYQESLNHALGELTYTHDIIDKYIIYSETDTKGFITKASSAFCDISQYSRDELIGAPHNIVRHPDMPPEAFREMWKTIQKGGTWNGEIKNMKKDGTYYWVDAAVLPKYDSKNNIIGFAAIRTDITDKKRVEDLTITDELTSLYNKRYFNRMFDFELRRAQRNGTDITLAVIDIDFFKNYNDTYGHLKGDKVLRRVALTLKKHLNRAGDYACRIGGEEFAVITMDMSPEQSFNLLEKIRKAVEDLKIEHSASEISSHVTISVGLYCGVPPMNTTVNNTFRKTDSALYNAKQAGRNRICVYDGNVTEQIRL